MSAQEIESPEQWTHLPLAIYVSFNGNHDELPLALFHAAGLQVPEVVFVVANFTEKLLLRLVQLCKLHGTMSANRGRWKETKQVLRTITSRSSSSKTASSERTTPVLCRYPLISPSVSPDYYFLCAISIDIEDIQSHNLVGKLGR
eukprot:751329-Hanusia_phi.AAC.2